VPWREGGAQALAGLVDDAGAPFFADPRGVLARVIARLAADLDLTPVVALEFEFYLLARRADRAGRPRPKRSEIGGEQSVQVYSIDALDQEPAFFEALDAFCADLEIPAKGASSEYAPGQFEVNLGHRGNALEAADHGFLLKRAVKAAARQAGASATFMAKPFAHQAANGLHLHVSLLDKDGLNIFAQDEAVLHRAIGGLQATMAEAMLIFAPNANSFRRLKPRSYAPIASTWGHNNRTVALRIPKSDGAARRIEHRVAGADANPYLVLAAVLAGLHHGLTNQIDPGPPISGNAYEEAAANLPITWDRAIEQMAAATLLPGYFGADFCRLYHVCRAAERDRYQDVIPALDHAWYQQSV
jgi:glutamine synthetase